VSALAPDAIAARVQAVFPNVIPFRSENGEPWLAVAPADLPGVAALLRNDAALACDCLMDLTGWDLKGYPAVPPSDDIAVVLLLFSMAHRHRVQLEVRAPRAACEVPSVSGLWPAALYFEREVFDLFGVTFRGHPSLRRIMTPDDWVGHPLRKDYVYPSEYHGVAHLREGQRFEGGPNRGSAGAAGGTA
jgi:NADH-quinone oxidoreductase subunit C